jgi:hypothetical protein
MTWFLLYAVLLLSFLLWRQYRAWQKAELAASVAQARVRAMRKEVNEQMVLNAKLTEDVDILVTYIQASAKQGKWVTAYPGLAELRIGRMH